MAKIKSTFINMVVVLTVITVIAGGALGYIYTLTAAPIAHAEKEKKENAIKAVAPDFDNSPTDEAIKVGMGENDTLTVYPARKEGKWVGAAVESNTKKGFSGAISVMVGFNEDGSIRNYSVLKHAETPGLGSKMNEWFRTEKGNQNIIGKNPANDGLTVSKDGGSVDAITAATISSRAFLDAIARAYKAYTGDTSADGASSASTKATDGTATATPQPESGNDTITITTEEAER